MEDRESQCNVSQTVEPAPCVLIVDDEPDILELIDITLSRMGVQCLLAETLAQANQILKEEAHRSLRLCLTDMRLPDGSGMELIRTIQAHYPSLPVAMITAHGNMTCAIEALKAGAFDFLNKPVDIKTLRELVTSALRLTLEKPAKVTTFSQHPLLGVSEPIEQVRRMIDKLARSQAPVYISGESGTGKELVARLIHAKGPRADKPFIPVNCGAIPADLMESELFGHRKGSFTGATSHKDGLFKAAEGGTLFLDEVADLPLDMQVKLLRVIQEKAVRPIGAAQEEHVDVRILSATHKDLAKKVAEGEFREDLFYRINVIQLHLPSLRDRRSDIDVLINHFLKQLASEMEVPVPRLTDSARDALNQHDFPGNVRELENILERAMTLCDSQQISCEDLSLRMSAPSAKPSQARDTQSSSDWRDEFTYAQEIGLEAYLETIEREMLTHALNETQHNKTAAAALLGISFRTLRYRLKKLNLE
ncbi:sigma-54-dependent transcriptional regulator [Nitrincola nitratireducens]|uniref:Nitrogen regulation protein NR(I) n=1 Tax=Nitrincola nitratireducens TaxID=1229521 RepID=W9UTN5_9GAMM|nr:sigma-54 dependent transcriptional regulator [Nitrincola nitratireducens]EXJ10593.1 Nitrogen regulation protein NR(I) [Nitrincola nitratireducens]